MIIDEITQIYLNSEHHKTKLSEAEARRYYERSISLDLMQVYKQEGEIKGYVEIWRINDEQLQRLLFDRPFDFYSEDLKSGPIAYIADVWIKSGERSRSIIYKLYRMAREYGSECDYFSPAHPNKHGYFKILKNMRNQHA